MMGKRKRIEARFALSASLFNKDVDGRTPFDPGEAVGLGDVAAFLPQAIAENCRSRQFG